MGDELHAIMVCPSFQKKRSDLISMIKQKVPNFTYLDDADKLTYILSSEDSDTIIQLSKFIHSILSTNRQPPDKQKNKRKQEKTLVSLYGSLSWETS